ncbi:hypothetical protein N9S30_00410 [bacterium]|nr:hypothetical protein [bacterium]
MLAEPVLEQQQQQRLVSSSSSPQEQVLLVVLLPVVLLPVVLLPAVLPYWGQHLDLRWTQRLVGSMSSFSLPERALVPERVRALGRVWTVVPGVAASYRLLPHRCSSRGRRPRAPCYCSVWVVFWNMGSRLATFGTTHLFVPSSVPGWARSGGNKWVRFSRGFAALDGIHADNAMTTGV